MLLLAPASLVTSSRLWYAAHFVMSNQWRRYDPEQDQASVTALLKDLRWDNLASSHKESICTLIFKILNSRVAIKKDLRPPLCKGNLRSAATAHHVQVCHTWTIFLPTHYRGLVPPSPAMNEDFILTWRVQGGLLPATLHRQDWFLSCIWFYPAPEFFMSHEHSQLIDAFYLVCMGNKLLHRWW